MEHLKTPIRLSDDPWLEGEPVDADGELLCFWQASHDGLLEVVQAVNERNELVAERDALVKACEVLDELGTMDEDVGVLTRLEKFVDCVILARFALALVKGKTDETAPAN